ncbi:MAG: hypothetical protein KDE47_01760, partial [Caldilineaceae bacterium]|nr:hypothetical protein [Caldilineaceae bacterium]
MGLSGHQGLELNNAFAFQLANTKRNAMGAWVMFLWAGIRDFYAQYTATVLATQASVSLVKSDAICCRCDLLILFALGKLLELRKLCIFYFRQILRVKQVYS